MKIHHHSVRVFFLGLAGLLAVGACGDSSSSRTVKDKAGRTCSVPESSLTVSCDAIPKPSIGCTSSETACFSRGAVVDPTSVLGPAAICAACCSGDQATTTEADCSQIVCATVDDCPLGSTQCKGGGCF